MLSGVISISNSKGSNIKVSSNEYNNIPSVVVAAQDLPFGELTSDLTLTSY
jgi:hypothetical protein